MAAAALGAAWVGLIWLLFSIHGIGGIGGFASVLGGLTGTAWMKARSRRATPEVADLLDLPATCPQFPVELRYSVRDCVYGHDEGIISFAGGWMHFQGRRTSWSLRALDVKVTMLESKQRTLYNSSSAAYRRITWYAPAAYQIRVLPIDSIEGLGGGLIKQFSSELTGWELKDEKPEGSAVLPPIEAMPGIARRLCRLVPYAQMLTLFTGGLLTAGFIVCLWSGWAYNCVTALMILLAASIVALSLNAAVGRPASVLARSCTNWPSQPPKRVTYRLGFAIGRMRGSLLGRRDRQSSRRIMKP